MQHDQGRIGFLLSLVAIVPSCDFDTSGTPRCDNAAHDDGDDDGKHDDDSHGDSGGGETGGSTGNAATGGSEGGEASGGATGEPGEGSSTTSTEEPPICQPYVDHYIECFPSGDAQVLLDGCIYSVNAGHAYSPECGSAVEDWYACLVATSCDVVLGGDPYCEAERAALDGACPSEDTTGG